MNNTIIWDIIIEERIKTQLIIMKCNSSFLLLQ